MKDYVLKANPTVKVLACRTNEPEGWVIINQGNSQFMKDERFQREYQPAVKETPEETKAREHKELLQTVTELISNQAEQERKIVKLQNTIKSMKTDFAQSLADIIMRMNHKGKHDGFFVGGVTGSGKVIGCQVRKECQEEDETWREYARTIFGIKK
jgi:23S rRNA pseudoU1915 N3-methylase RlmH